MKDKRKLLLGILLIIQLAVLLYFGSQKQGMHFDEYYSYFTTNNSDGRAVNDRQWLNSQDMKKDFYVQDGEQFQYEKVIQLQSYDVHPPVFYLLLHTLCSLMPGVYSIWQGLALNIMYELIATVCLYLILDKLTHNQWAAFLIVLICITNPGVISNVMFIRMYMLLTMWMMIAIWLHLCMGEKWHWSFLLLNSALAYVGFLTHYYYLAFLFFLEAAYWLPRFRKEWKRFLLYGTSMLGAGALAVFSYPACLGHIFAGYRGKQATGNLLNLTDIQARWLFFSGLMNKYVFHGAMFPILCLTMFFLFVLLLKRHKSMGSFVQCLLIPTVGYFCVSLKASLYGEEAMLRYQISIYILILACIGVIGYLFLQEFVRGEHSEKFKRVSYTVLTIVLLFMNLVGLGQKGVYFCYPEQAAMTAFAREHAADTVIYLYHKEEYKYLIWADAEPLWNYEKVYFVSTQDMSALEDQEIQQADHLIVYSSIMGAENTMEEYADLIYRSNPKLKKCQEACQGVYATAYLFE